MSAIPDLHAIATGQTGPVRIEPSPRRVRVRVGGTWVADSEHVLYLFEEDHLPVYYFPLADVREDLFVATEHHTTCPHKGEADYWHLAIEDRMIEHAVWRYPEVIDGCPDITGHVAFFWDRVDAWFEEDEEVFVHARDPYKRIDTVRSSRHLQVLIGGIVVADTERPVLLYETGLPTRYYIPRLDVREELLTPTATSTRCPYKGIAEYWSVDIGDASHDDVVWAYPAPIPEIPKIEAHLCFFNEHVDLVLDGVALDRPASPWS